MKVAELKKEFDNASISKTKELIETYKNDTRKGVINLVNKSLQKIQNYEKEKIRVRNLNIFENMCITEGYKFIAGIDEVGRGPLAGPVVACAVILPKDTFIDGINDSKKLSEQKRKKVLEDIRKCALSIGIGLVDQNIIDDINILNATKLAMLRAVENLHIKPQILLIDALNIEYNLPQKAIIRGDERSISIAAASIVAKVYRDKLMCKYAKEYPQYGFEKNKGYGSVSHIESIKKYGICPLHRHSFIKNFI